MSAMFLFILTSASVNFLDRTTQSTQMSSAVRDNAQSMLLAESALEYVRGQFVNQLLNTDATTRVATCEDANSNTSDLCEATDIQANKSDPRAKLFSYMYYLTAGNDISQTTPQILQLVSNGEAANTTPATLGSQNIAYDANNPQRVRITDLFAASFKPLLFVSNANGMVTTSAAANWTAESNPSKAAVWFELTENSSNSDAVDIYVQAAAQVDSAKSYIQRYVGSFGTSSVLGNVSILSEASNIDRSGT